MKTVKPLASRTLIRSLPHRRVLAVIGKTQVGLWVLRSLGRAELSVYAVCRDSIGKGEGP